ncbi:MAG TPA: Ku protein [Terriglobales bacterium]|nr:Ku protein [Terriglobales bacterium]
MAGVWSGYLSFGLVTLPVRLQAGARGERVSFHLLHARDHARLKQQMVCSEDGEVVPRQETVRGYEYGKGEYVVVSDAAIQAAAPATERQLAILEFCRAEEIDPLWFESAYYLLPEPAGRRGYALLLRAMQEAGVWAVAQLSMHNREYLSLVRPTSLAGVPASHRGEGRSGLLLHTLYYLDEMRVAEGFGAVAAEAPAAELKLARQLIEGLIRRFDPSRFEDHYRKNLEALVQAALAGKPAPSVAKGPRLEPVADLMASLKASLARPQPGAQKQATAPGKSKSGRRRAA